ncbi:hypothetical protein TraAM80_08600 [Trypanosoma rangeli]|uniref:Uncharacterized protein n=1 Tax=Trypanosoma rangeli TaxID=5698 RepID=A0A422MZU3_TRYRA|nr:uncharacterized protein TraAM80_08600 [Trypanosoma rangeli]RNE98748.1 hypothetical protein TraAM80_08600 [Trypanosoma rangeli]|eukprot:RNE98748.1 hypothetical protein TraAM80_08600 [Trypanosoma rangeli]
MLMTGKIPHQKANPTKKKGPSFSPAHTPEKEKRYCRQGRNTADLTRKQPSTQQKKKQDRPTRHPRGALNNGLQPHCGVRALFPRRSGLPEKFTAIRGATEKRAAPGRFPLKGVAVSCRSRCLLYYSFYWVILTLFK